MSENAGVSGAPIFQEIKTGPPERPYRFRSLAFLTYATLATVGLNAGLVVLVIVALAGRWALLGQAVGQTDGVPGALLTAIRGNDVFVGVSIVFMLLSLIPAYVVGAFWTYNAACNVRALGARGLRISPGWAVGWFAVPFMSLFKPFQAFEEIYLASGSPVGWRQAKTPWLLRWWWGLWLAAGFGGYAVSVVARGQTTAAGLISATQMIMALFAVTAISCGLFLTIVWRVFRAQNHSRSQVQQISQVFA